MSISCKTQRIDKYLNLGFHLIQDYHPAIARDFAMICFCGSSVLLHGIPAHLISSTHHNAINPPERCLCGGILTSKKHVDTKVHQKYIKKLQRSKNNLNS